MPCCGCCSTPPPRSSSAIRPRSTSRCGWLALAGSQRAQVLVARPRAETGTEEAVGLGSAGPARRGRAGLAALLADLGARAAHGRVSLSRAIDQTLVRSARPGLLVVISDFLDPGPVTAALDRARSAGHDVALVHVIARGEIQPSYDGDYALEDAETGALVEVTMDPAALEAYALRFAGLVEELRGWSRKHGASYVRVVTDEPLEGAVRRFVARGVD
jgi:uncharacterized protein (DUF58 family)